MFPSTVSKSLKLYHKHPYFALALLLALYLAVYWLAAHSFPASLGFQPAIAVALCVLFFGGVRVWPLVYLTALLAAILGGLPLISLLTEPIAVTLQASTGAYLLHRGHLDPLFRGHRDMFYLFGVILAISLIPPSFAVIESIIRALPYGISQWGHSYVAAITSFIAITPFILRWFTKPSFRRGASELYEVGAVFTVLIGINYALFTLGIPTAFGIPLGYVLLIPLFYIALKLRPRFVTLSILLTSVFALANVLTRASAETLGEQLLGTQLFLITLAVIFYIVVSLEEDRRVNTNIMHSQLGTLQNALARISSESNAKKDFIAILGHELRNPLAPVASGIEVLKLKGVGDADDAKTLDIMEGQVTTIRHLLDDLLDISRISEGKVAFKPETVDLRLALNRAILSTNHHRKQLHQSLVFTAPEEPVYVTGDIVRLEQIFSNLLTNASKYSESGDTITLTVRKHSRTVEVEVKDHGMGISPDMLETIFTPFHQIEHGARSQKGLGIGLSLVRNFVELHGGTVVAASKGLGRGSRFTVRLPVFSSPPSEETGRTPDHEKVAAKSRQNICVLVVDDNDAAAAGIGRLLELKGCSIMYAYTGSQAIDKALQSLPDVVLLDVGLPDMDGYAVAETLRARGFNGLLIGLTGYGSEDAKERGKQAGLDHHLVKPVGIADLMRLFPELT